MSAAEFRPTERALAFLLTPEGEALLADLSSAQVNEDSLLQHTGRLRKTHPPDVVAAALDVTLLRRKAYHKFTRAQEMFFTRQALEQASAEVVSRYRAPRFARYPAVGDLCCGIGGDALSLAAHGDVLAVDIDPIRVRMAEANARVYAVHERLRAIRDDVTHCPPLEGLPFWADPSRRIDGRRVFSLHSYRPSLPALLRLARKAPAAAIKLSPGVSYDELDALLDDTPHEIEIISVRGEAREAVLWLGELRTTTRRATLLPGGHTLTERPLREPIPVVQPSCYLYEPDAAVIRAHLVEHLAEDLCARKIDDQIAYLTSETPIDSPFVSAYGIEQVIPFGLKRLNRCLQSMDIGELIVKKRGLALDPERFRRRLKYGGGKRRIVLILTRVSDQPTALICHPASGDQKPGLCFGRV